MSDANDIGETVPVNAQTATTTQSSGDSPPEARGAGRTKVRLRASMERSDAYKRLPSGAWRVIAALWELADAPRGSEPFVHGRCKVDTLADRTGLGRSQVHRWLRRLRVLEPGQARPEGWLGGWIDTHCRAGRFLAWTVYATPSDGSGTVSKPIEASEPVAEPDPTGRLEATPADAKMRQEVSHPCDTDRPPCRSTTKHHHQHARATRERADAAGDPPRTGGGGGGEDFDSIRTELQRAGVWAAKVEDLAQRVAATPNGLARLRATIDRGRKFATNLAGFLTKTIERDELDDAPSERRPAPRANPDEFKAWAKGWAHQFQAMTDAIRQAGGSPSETIAGAKAVRLAEDPKAWAELWGMAPAIQRAEVAEAFNELNRRLAGLGVEPFASLGGSSCGDAAGVAAADVFAG